MSMLSEGMAALRSAESEWFGEQIVYRRSDGVSYEIVAVPGQTRFHARNDSGVFISQQVRDFIVRPGEIAGEPVQGDEIVFQGEVYEVLAPNGEPVWRWSDPLRTAMRIHTKHTGGET